MISVNVFNEPVLSPPDANGPAGFTTLWHGHGAGHQDGNSPGQSADQRHAFDQANAGRSEHNPTEGSAQDDFSAESGLPLVAMPQGAHDHDADAEADEMDMLI